MPGAVVVPGSAQAWLLAIRPRTLPASAAPVILGWALAATAGPVRWPLGAACLVVALALQAAANLANDYFDAQSGVDRAERLGPVRVTQTGLLQPSQVLGGLVICLAIGAIAGLFAAWQAGWWLVGLGAVCLLGAVAYTAGPLPLAHLGLGEVAALVFFGPVACTGTFTALHGAPTAAAWAAGLVPGCHAAALMAVNNLRDLASDRAAGKRTLAVRAGERAARLVPVVCLVLGNLLVAPLARLAGRPLAFLALALVPLSWPLLRSILREPLSPAFNTTLAGVGRWELLTAIVVSALLVL
ncbi:MAG TPA: 1,4-dihydroxy-2-naphthoate octaprenyltransferase [Candidatus Krumholzibacteria bacterium]|nr:1,4-dihydroxy-2-naphthoate octaprenyltransferase [Candidatus Krumholzibacteria bacterium]HPD71276.1 1,4-dihydroxy-2-naphthoate octaprenyltransferase [Candidatus Krumholzibacteria bacterium]HRY39024.1 1,4-dihydroxy-2-naphthoate octaprenyltransferase [Candidatus Krumholzibacteria bacterium]